MVQVGEEMPMIYGYKKDGADWVQHDDYGVWSLLVNDDGVI